LASKWQGTRSIFQGDGLRPEQLLGELQEPQMAADELKRQAVEARQPGPVDRPRPAHRIEQDRRDRERLEQRIDVEGVADVLLETLAQRGSTASDPSSNAGHSGLRSTGCRPGSGSPRRSRRRK
jgi:hypothetical protein